MTAFVRVELDTLAPQVSVEMDARVVPPTVLLVNVTINEPMGPSSFFFIDAAGIEHGLGFVQVDEFTALVEINTVLLLGGTGSFRAEIRDRVGNKTVVDTTVLIDREAVFLGSLTFRHFYDVQLNVGRLYHAELTMAAA